MSEGLILLGVMGLFFLSMYLYAYGTTNYAGKKAEKARKRLLLEAQEKEQAIKSKMLERQNLREEKYRLANARSKEIQNELKRLGKLKQQSESVIA